MRDAAAERASSSRPRSSATACRRSARCSSASGSTGESMRHASTPSPSRSTASEANAQVFQVRDGVLSDRQSFYLDQRGRARRSGRCSRSSCSSTTSAAPRSRRRSWSRRAGDRRRSPRRSRERRGGRGRAAGAPSAARSAASSSWPSATPGSRSTRTSSPLRAPPRSGRAEALDGLQRALGLDALPIRIECFDISNLEGHPHGRLDGRLRGRRAQEVRLPALQDPHASRAARRLRLDGARCSVAGLPTGSARPTSRRTIPSYDPSFAALPNLVVIDGGKGQLAAGLDRAARASASRGVAVDLAGQAHRGGLHARASPRRSCSTTTRPSCSCCSASATRRTASRSPTTAPGATGR